MLLAITTLGHNKLAALLDTTNPQPVCAILAAGVQHLVGRSAYVSSAASHVTHGLGCQRTLAYALTTGCAVAGSVTAHASNNLINMARTGLACRSPEMRLESVLMAGSSCSCRKRDGQSNKLLRLEALRLGITCTHAEPAWDPAFNLKFRTTDLIFNINNLSIRHRDAADLVVHCNPKQPGQYVTGYQAASSVVSSKSL